MRTKVCGNCEYFEAVGLVKGQDGADLATGNCRWKPPSVTLATIMVPGTIENPNPHNELKPARLLPLMTEREWCGQFVETTERPSKPAIATN